MRMVKSQSKPQSTLTVYGIHEDDELHADNLDPHHTSFMVAMIPLVLVIGINALLTMRFFRIWISLHCKRSLKTWISR